MSLGFQSQLFNDRVRAEWLFNRQVWRILPSKEDPRCYNLRISDGFLTGTLDLLRKVDVLPLERNY